MITGNDVIILTLAGGTGLYKTLIDTCKETWFTQPSDKIKTFFYYGGHKEFKVENENIYCSSVEDYGKLGLKTVETFEYIYNNYDFKYIFRTNAGTYIKYNELLNHLSDKPMENYYSGIIGHYANTDYASGSGYFLSRDVVKKILDNREQLSHNFIDDVELGILLKKLDIIVSEDAIRISINYDPGYRTFEYQKGRNQVNKEEIENMNYHYRLKSNNRLFDIDEMKNIHNGNINHNYTYNWNNK
jgi:hypothetical protein